MALQAAILLALLYASYVAKKKDFRKHCSVMLVATVLNTASILFVMAPSFIGFMSMLRPSDLSQPIIATSVIHSMIGMIAWVLSVLIILRMKRLIPLLPGFRLMKNVMLTTLILWLVAMFLGAYIYARIY